VPTNNFNFLIDFSISVFSINFLFLIDFLNSFVFLNQIIDFVLFFIKSVKNLISEHFSLLGKRRVLEVIKSHLI